MAFGLQSPWGVIQEVPCLMKGCLFAAALLALPHPSVHAAVTPPTNGWVVWGSDRLDGRHEIYLMQADGIGVTRLTFNGGKAPAWSHDGRWIAYNHTPDDSVHVIRWNGTGDKQICPKNIKQSNGGYLPPFWLHDKSGVLCASGGDYRVVHPDTGVTKPLFKHADFTQIAGADFMPSSMTADNRWVLSATDRYRKGHSGSNGTFKAYWSAVILDRQNPGELYFFGPGCEPMTPPWGDSLYHVCGSSSFCPHGYDIARMSIKDVISRSSYAPEIANSDASWGHEYFPRVSNDNKWLAYGASTGCHDHDLCDYEIFIHPLGGGTSSRLRLTTNPKNDRWPHLYVGELWQPSTLTDSGATGPVKEAGPSVKEAGASSDAGASDAGVTSPDGAAMSGQTGSRSRSQMTDTLVGGCSHGAGGAPCGWGGPLVLACLLLLRRLSG